MNGDGSNGVKMFGRDTIITELVKRLNCSREAAASIPPHLANIIIQIIPTEPIPLTQREMEIGKQLAKDIAEAKHTPLKVIKRIPDNGGHNG